MAQSECKLRRFSGYNHPVGAFFRKRKLLLTAVDSKVGDNSAVLYNAYAQISLAYLNGICKRNRIRPDRYLLCLTDAGQLIYSEPIRIVDGIFYLHIAYI